VLSRISAFLRDDVPAEELDPFRRAGSDAYQLVDDSPPTSWVRLAAWMAFLLQIYADNLISASKPPTRVRADTAQVAREMYELVGAWLDCARRLAETPSSTLNFHLPCPPPHWHTPLRSPEQLAGMRKTLEDARARVASDLQAFAGDAPDRDLLHKRLAAIDSSIETVDLLWVARASLELRGAIGDALRAGLDGAAELGQLLAQPELILRLL